MSSLSLPIFFIGMPGAGKSTLGKLLACQLSVPFIDTDHLVENDTGESLQSYLDTYGYKQLRVVEERILLTHNFGSAVVATGGSVVYSQKGMQRLQKLGLCVYLYISLEEMMSRIHNASQRGLACAPGTKLEALFQERDHLYRRYASKTMSMDSLSVEQSLFRLKEELGANSHN